jgi:ATP-dependent helicase/nuclease subunit A
MSDELDAPAGRTFELTPEQRAAVETRGRNVYVTAAAGSGKTAVLTERVFRLVAEPGPGGEPPVELERLLVITFTRKAAQEMRERIERRIRSALDAHPDSPVLRAALDALTHSHIMTIDAFCDRIVRRHFHLAGVSPTVRLADEDEELEIVHAATREVFEASAAGEEGLGTGVFADLLRSTPPSRGGLLESLEQRIDRLRAYVAALEDGAGWMESARRSLEARRDAESIEVLPDLDLIDDAFRREIAEVAEVLGRLRLAALDIVGSGDSIPVDEAWRTACDRFDKAARSPVGRGEVPFVTRWRALRDTLASDSLAPSLRKLHLKSSCGPVLYDSDLQGLLKKFSADCEKWLETWFAHDEEQMLEAERLAGAQGLALLDLAEAVERRARAIKRRRGLMSFGDIQRAALRLLTGDGGPSAVALEYREFFEAVLVDEYQDVSPLQDALIRRVARPADPASGRAGNLFIVGDVKQSIYRFRQAEPILFRSRLDDGREPADPTRPLTLSLSANFRSRPGLLEAVNELFRGLMDRDIGDVEMTGDALLVPGRPAGDANAPPCVELQWIDDGEIVRDDADNGESGADGDEAGADPRGIEAEARWIARRIRDLERADAPHWIADEQAPGGRRPVRPSDCAILVRAIAGSIDLWVAELGRWNIRVRTTGGESLWNSVEGRDLLAALRLVDQPLDDAALATVLRSPLAGFSDDDLLALRMAGGGPFWNAVWSAGGRRLTDGADDTDRTALDHALEARLRAFFDRLDRWRALALSHPAEAVLDVILADTGYEAHVLGGPRADAGARNVDELRGRIRIRERQGNHGSGLSDFLRAFQAEGREARDREDESLRLDPDAVQLMTVHKSKGLEFPVVFLAGMGRRYNTDHRSSALLFSPRGSMALAGVHPRRKVRLEPPSLLAGHSREARALRGEELRLLYVAMTRARERLVLVASGRGLRRHRSPGSSLVELGAPAPAFARVRASSPAALVGPRMHALARPSAPYWLQLHEEASLAIPPAAVDLEPLRAALTSTGEAVGEVWRRAVADWSALSSGEPTPEIASAFPPRLVDSLATVASTPLKLRPSALTRADESAVMEEKPAESLLFDEEEMRPVRRRPTHAGAVHPCFSLQAAGEALTPVERGRIAHAFLQHLELAGPLDGEGLRAQAARLAAEGRLGADAPASIDAVPFDGIAAFFASPLGRRLAARPGSVSRELPFTRWARLRELAHLGARIDGADPERLVTVQGVIDCVLDEGDRITLIDYKSDAHKDETDIRRLSERYALQLELYADALRAAWNLAEVPETYLVFLRSGHAESMNAHFSAC